MECVMDHLPQHMGFMLFWNFYLRFCQPMKFTKNSGPQNLMIKQYFYTSERPIVCWEEREIQRGVLREVLREKGSHGLPEMCQERSMVVMNCKVAVDRCGADKIRVKPSVLSEPQTHQCIIPTARRRGYQEHYP